MLWKLSGNIGTKNREATAVETISKRPLSASSFRDHYRQSDLKGRLIFLGGSTLCTDSSHPRKIVTATLATEGASVVFIWMVSWVHLARTHGSRRRAKHAYSQAFHSWERRDSVEEARFTGSPAAPVICSATSTSISTYCENLYT